MNITPTLYHGTARLLAVVARLGSRLLGCAVATFAAHAIIALALALASGHPWASMAFTSIPLCGPPGPLRSCTCSAA